jgi:SAM-dependent methyltransferase
LSAEPIAEPRRELLLGCGADHSRRIGVEGRQGWDDLTTLDVNADHSPDIVHDLNHFPWPIEDDSFDEIHAYEVVEHLGTQGDWMAFFDFFTEIHRILKPGGKFAATCPSYKSMWAWGDPSHTRVITRGSLVFLSQAEYERQAGNTPMSDFRYYYKVDFLPIWVNETDEQLAFVVEARTTEQTEAALEEVREKRRLDGQKPTGVD